MVSMETREQCKTLKLEDLPATKILYAMLTNYVNDGTTYVNKELRFHASQDIMPRKFIVSLHNNKGKKDSVLIRSDAPEED